VVTVFRIPDVVMIQYQGPSRELGKRGQCGRARREMFAVFVPQTIGAERVEMVVISISTG
jgi:predicted RNA-binding protein with TRAM domain